MRVFVLSYCDGGHIEVVDVLPYLGCREDSDVASFLKYWLRWFFPWRYY